MKNLLRFVLLIAVLWFAAQSYAQTPAEALQKAVDDSRPYMRIMLEDHPGNIGFLKEKLGNDPNAVLGQVAPDQAANLESWSIKEGIPNADMPITWDDRPTGWFDKQRKFEFMRLPFEKSSHAMVQFVWYYLRAYEHLNSALRNSHSTLAVGAAALVAAEALYPTNYACLPREIQHAAAIVNLLKLYQPGILKACFDEKEEKSLPGLLNNAVNRLCSVPKTDKKAYGNIHARILTLKTEPVNKAVGGKRPMLVDDIVPVHPASLERLMQKAKGSVGNLTLRGLIIQAAGQKLYGIPFEHQGPGKPSGEKKNPAEMWQQETEQFKSAVVQELALRNNARAVAPDYMKSRELVSGDPSVLRPLMVMAAFAAYPALKDAQGKDADAYLGILKKHPVTKPVLELSGADPQVEMQLSQRSRSQKTILINGKLVIRNIPNKGMEALPARLIWQNLSRNSLDKAQPGSFRPEELIVDLISYRPVGGGKPIKGVSADSWVTVLENGREVRKQAKDVKAGHRVRGYINTAKLHDEEGIKPNREMRPEWFLVLATERHEKVPLTQTLGLNLNGTIREIALALPHLTFLKVGNKVMWRAAMNTDIGSDYWAGGENNPSLAYVRENKSPVDLMEFTLHYERERRQAHCLLISSDENTDSPSLLAEARSIDVGPVDERAPVLLGDFQSTIDAGEVKTNPKLNPDSKAGPVAAYYLGQKRPWPTPPARYATYVLKKTITDPEMDMEMIKLIMENGHKLITSCYNSFLTKGDNSELKPVVGALLNPGALLLTDLNEKGEPQFLPLRSVGPIPERETPSGTRRFVLLELCNLEYAKIGPVVVSVDSRARDKGKVGLLEGTKLNILNPGSGGTSSGTLSERTHPLGPTNPKTAFAFVEIALDTLLPGRLNQKNGVASTSRTLVVHVKNGDRTSKIECGYCTPLVVVLPNKKPLGHKENLIKRKDAYELEPGQGVLVASANASKAKPWQVTSVVPKFYPTTQLFEPISPVRGTWFREAFAEVHVLLAENMAVLLKVPGAQEPDKPTMPLPGQDGEGEATGTSEMRVEEGEYVQIPQREGFIPRIFAPDEDDPITIGREAKYTLLNRGRDIVSMYEEEKTKILNARPDQGKIALLKKLLPGFSLPDSSEERYEAIGRYVRALIENREFFIKDNLYSCRLPPLLFQETVTAILLQEYGAKKAAGLICTDMIELAVFAGCETDREKQKTRLSPYYGLPLILRVPHWIKGKEGHQTLDTVRFPLGKHALTKITDWSNTIERVDVVSTNERTGTPQEANLAGLLSYFVSLGGDGLDPSFITLRPPSADGTLQDKDFQSWLNKQAETIRKRMEERKEAERKEKEAADRKREELEVRYRPIEIREG